MQHNRLFAICALAGLVSACGGGGQQSDIPAGTAPIDAPGSGVPSQGTPSTAPPSTPSSDPSSAPVAQPSTVTSASASTITQTHVLTADYLGAPFGTTSISPSSAAPYLNWASVGVPNSTTIHEAGIKTEWYTSPYRTRSTDPLYTMVGGAGFSTTCGGDRIYTDYTGIPMYMMDPDSAAVETAYRQLVASAEASGTIDALYQDNGVEPGYYIKGTWVPGMPCEYSDSNWIIAAERLNASVGKAAIINGLSSVTETGVSELVSVVEDSPSVIGGNFESCFNASTQPEEGVWVWTDTEQTQIDLVGHRKYFQCMGGVQSDASLEPASRIFTLASFLMTYSPAYSIMWSQFATPSGLHVMPEAGLVPLDPLVAQPSSIALLESPQKTYVREYAACYYRGKLIGGCAMVVNDQRYAYPSPTFRQSYHHTLTVSGAGLLDGGTVSFSGAAPPATMAPLSAYIALP